MTKPLPKTLYVARLQESDDYEWLSAEETAEELADSRETRTVGVYVLKELLSVSLEVKSEVIVEKTAKSA